MWTSRKLISLTLSKPLRPSLIRHTAPCLTYLKSHNMCNYEDRKRSELKLKKKSNRAMPIMAVYGTAISILMISGNYHLIALPAVAGAIHYLKLAGGSTSFTTSYELSKLHKKNKQLRQVFEELSKELVHNPQLKDYFDNEESVMIYNPTFEDFQFREKGIVSDLDEHRLRKSSP